jgi:hypothetical protein
VAMRLDLLLSQISSITKKHDGISRITGEYFNIFNLLNVTYHEISHSKIIASLLDTKGSHGKGDVFLKLFISSVGLTDKDFATNDASVEIEKFIGYISEDYSSGGYIDIVISNNKNQKILIENKLGAEDQRNQLLRYHNWNPRAHLLYLTLDGQEPSEYSTGKLVDYYKCISYEKHILDWLKLCKKETVDNPLLRETLTQYIILIKQITEQSRSDEVEKDYLGIILKDADNVSAAFTISTLVNSIKINIFEKIFDPMIRKIAEELGLLVEFDSDVYWNKEKGFRLFKQDWNKTRIIFEFERNNFRDMYCGITDVVIPKDLQEECIENQKFEVAEGYPLYKYMDDCLSWSDEVLLEIYNNNNKLISTFKDRIIELEAIVRKIHDAKK